MNYFSDQIKNASTGFAIRLYEITRQYSIMSLLRIEESVGLAPMAHGQDLLGSRDTQGTEPAKLAPDGTTETQTIRIFPTLLYPTLPYFSYFPYPHLKVNLE